MRDTIPPELRFWTHVILKGPKRRKKIGRCWDWKTKNGIAKNHPRFRIDHRVVGAYVYSYMIHKGPVPDGMCVCHKCDYPPCTRPNHLFLATQKENIRDASRKGRMAHSFYGSTYRKKYRE